MSIEDLTAGRQTGKPKANPGAFHSTRRSVLTLLPVALTGLAAAAVGVQILRREPAAPATMLGGIGALPGGLAQIRGIIPLESAQWRPPPPVTGLQGAPAAGSHRVRILLELTSTENAGINFVASDYRVEDFAVLSVPPLWADEQEAQLRPGQSRQFTMVFEIPDRAIALVLAGSGQLRLGLGTDHHS